MSMGAGVLVAAAALAVGGTAESSSARRSQQVVTIGGAQLFVSDEGTGVPVVLLHGGFMDSTMWDADAAVLKQRHRVIRVDFRGYGRSPQSASPYEPTDDIAALLDHLRIERAHIVGISMGGGIAVDFALAHPARVRTLVLAEPGLSSWQWSSDVTDTMEAVMRAHREKGRDAAIEEMLRRPVFASAKQKPEALAVIRAQLQRNFALDSRGMRPADRPAAERLSELRVPVLVMTAELGGPDARAIAAAIRTAVPGAEVVEVTGSGHMINLEAPERFRELVLAFVSRR